jgi:hypothetical protein
MITPILEKLIAQGIAKSATWTLGGAGASSINVPNNEVAIIHHFDYWHFADVKNSNAGSPDTFQFTIDSGVTNPVLAQIQIDGFPPVPAFVSFDNTDIPGTAVNIQTFLTGAFPGFTVTSVVFALGVWTVTFVTTPTDIYNGSVLSVATLPPLPTVSSNFGNGVSPSASLQDVIDASEHILEFRTKNSRNSFAIRENVKIFNWFDVLGFEGFFYNVSGVYSKDCYLVHQENIQVDIWRVPQPGGWAVQFKPPQNKSNENSTPVGYGINALGLNTALEILLDGVSEQYLPLTNQRTDLVTGDLLNQFRPNINGTRNLANPTIVIGAQGNGKNYPLVNVDYVLITAKNYSKYLGNSV